MSALIEGKFTGMIQEDGGFKGFFAPDKTRSAGGWDDPTCEITVPITSEQFHQLPLNKPVKLLVQIVV